jgi:hypothetical protein
MLIGAGGRVIAAKRSADTTRPSALSCDGEGPVPQSRIGRERRRGPLGD